MESMLPDADDFPSPAPEMVVYAAVAGHVGLAFAVPAGAVSFRPGVTLWAVVPTASAATRRNVKSQDVTPLPSDPTCQVSSTCQCPPFAGPTRRTMPSAVRRRICHSMPLAERPSCDAKDAMDMPGSAAKRPRIFSLVFSLVFPLVLPEVSGDAARAWR